MPSSACKKCARSEEHTSELQSHDNLVCRLLLEKNTTPLPVHHPARHARSRLTPLPITPRAEARASTMFSSGSGRAFGGPWWGSVFVFFNKGAPPEFSTLPQPAPLPV